MLLKMTSVPSAHLATPAPSHRVPLVSRRRREGGWAGSKEASAQKKRPREPCGWGEGEELQSLWDTLFQHKQRWQRLSCFLPLIPPRCCQALARTASAGGGQCLSASLQISSRPHNLLHSHSPPVRSVHLFPADATAHGCPHVRPPSSSPLSRFLLGSSLLCYVLLAYVPWTHHSPFSEAHGAEAGREGTLAGCLPGQRHLVGQSPIRQWPRRCRWVCCVPQRQVPCPARGPGERAGVAPGHTPEKIKLQARAFQGQEIGSPGPHLGEGRSCPLPAAPRCPGLRLVQHARPAPGFGSCDQEEDELSLSLRS